MNNLQKKYREEVLPKLMKEFERGNAMAVSRPEKVSVNVGLSRAASDPNFASAVAEDLKLIAGQTPVKTKARKAISGFKIRKNQEIGVAVTLRGPRMWDFLEKMIGAAIPRIRDFQGIDLRNFNAQGNFSYGFKEQLVFPEISHDDISTIFGMQVNVKLTGSDRTENIQLMKMLGFPLRENK